MTNRKYYKKYRKSRRRATARREPRCSYTATIGTVLHIQHRSIQTKVDKVTLTTIEALTPISAQRPTSNTEEYKNKPTRSHIPATKKFSKKSPRGVQRGRGFTAPLRFSTASQSKKTMSSAKKSKTYITSAQRSTSNTEAYRNKPTPLHIPTTKNSSKKARGVCRGAVALRPLCGFP